MVEEIREIFFNHGAKLLSLSASRISEWSPTDSTSFIVTKQTILDESTVFIGCADAAGEYNYSKLMTYFRGIVRGIDGRNCDQFALSLNAMREFLNLLLAKLNDRVSVEDLEMKEWQDKLSQSMQVQAIAFQGLDEIEYYRLHMNQYFAKVNGRPPTVLIVDDDEDVRDAIGSLIGNIPFDIVESRNGHEAWTLIESRLIDVVVSDFLMPLLNGLELINRMKVERVTTPVILISGYRERLKSKSAIEMGAFAFFEKPFSLRNLELSVLKAVGTGLHDTINSKSISDQFAKYLQASRSVATILPESFSSNLRDELIIKRRLLDLFSGT